MLGTENWRAIAPWKRNSCYAASCCHVEFKPGESTSSGFSRDATIERWFVSWFLVVIDVFNIYIYIALDKYNITVGRILWISGIAFFFGKSFQALCGCVCVCVCTQSLSCVQLFVIPRTVAYQVPLSIGFPSQEYRNGLPFPSPGDHPDPGIKIMSLMSPAPALGGW